MLLNINTDPRDHSSCALSYNEQERWLLAVWRGYVNPAEAMQGAQAYLLHAVNHSCGLLLNDNSKLAGPWFDSLDWLAEVWMPQAVRLGLRYVAHITQADRHYDILSSALPDDLPFELQIFRDSTDACHWLRERRAALEGGTVLALPRSRD